MTKRRPTAAIVLDALLLGLPVKLPDEETYVLLQDDDTTDSKPHLAVQASRVQFGPGTTGELEPCYLGADWVTLDYLLYQCSLMSEQDRSTLVANVALNQIQLER
jgi:hypothetical protein